MAQYSVAAPDGSIIDLTGPDGASEEEIKAEAHKIYLTNQETQRAKSAEAVQANATQAESVNAPVESFTSSAVNALGFGLPEYLAKKYGTVTQTPQQAAQVYEQRDINNPMASKAGELTGDVAGLVVPAGLGAKAGLKAANAGMDVYKASQAKAAIQASPELSKLQSAVDAAETMVRKGGSINYPFLRRAQEQLSEALARTLSASSNQVSKVLTPAVKYAAAGTGGAMGAQTGAAIPSLIQGDVPGAIAKSAEVGQTIGQLPVVGPTYAATAGQAVPAGIAALSSMAPQIKNGLYNTLPGMSSMEKMIRELAAKYVLTNTGQQRP